MTQIAYPGNKAVIAHSYDAAGHQVKVESLWGTGVDEVFCEASGFNEDDQATVIDYGNGVSTQTQFYTAPRRLKRVYTSTATSTIQDITYTYDKVSNILGVANAAHIGSQSCSLSSIVYDDLHRLTSLYSTSEGRTITYEYTPIGNINRNGEMGTQAYTYHATKPHAVIGANNNTYAYDDCGNMTTRNSAAYGNQTLTYDAQNRLVRVYNSTDQNDVTFGYSAGGSRLWKKVNGQVTGLWIGSLYEEKDGQVLCHVYAGSRLVATFEPESGFACFIGHRPYLAAIWNFGDGAFTVFFSGGRGPLSIMAMAILAGLAYALRIGRLGAERRCASGPHDTPKRAMTLVLRRVVLTSMAASVFLSSNPQAAYAGLGTPDYDPVFYYYHPDHLGSSQLMTDRDGDVVQHYGYTPYGKENYKNDTLAFPVSSRYTGQTLDEDTGLYYYGARYYDPELACFIQADSVVPDPGSSQACNRYAYCYGNPLTLIDPTGHSPQWGGMIPGAYMGAVQAGLGGGDMLTGAFIGAINGAAGYQVIPTINSASTLLTATLTGNTITQVSITESTPFAPDPPPHKDKESDPPKPQLPVTYDFASGEDTLARFREMNRREVVHFALDIAGTLDPTPTFDTLNAALYATEGRYGQAALSLAGAAAYFGDSLKAGRYTARAVEYSCGIGRTNQQLVQEIASRTGAWATRKGLSGTPQSIGIAQHRHAKRMLDHYQGMYGHRGLSTEVRYVNQMLWQRGTGMSTRGSVILDVVDGPLTSPTAIYDYKFGAAGLSPGRINQIRRVTDFRTVPIHKVRP